jgi:hypothetical protein
MAEKQEPGHTLRGQLREKLGLRKCGVCHEWDKKRFMRPIRKPSGAIVYVHLRHFKG